MNISGVLVHTRPAQRDAIAGRLGAIAGVEIHAVNNDGRIVVTVEEAPGDGGRAMTEIHNTPGVVAAALVYQHDESDPSAEAPTSVAEPEGA